MNYQTLNGYENLVVSKRRVMGELASWAVQQSPYPAPDNLYDALIAFHQKWPHGDYQEFQNMHILEDEIFFVFEQIPEILVWNERKNGRDGMGFTSRYDEPSPDDDFIDLHALARNVAMGTWADCVDFKLFNDDFDRRHGKAASEALTDE